MVTTLWQIVWRDVRLALRSRAEATLAIAFFLLVILLFPFGISPERSVLKELGPAIMWIAALLATLLSLGRLFAHDHADGTLEQLQLLPLPLPLVVLAKVLAHWLVSGLPLVVLTPVLAALFDLDGAVVGWLTLSLLLGTWILSLLGAVGAALTLGVKNSVLVPLLVLPWFLPVLIFGTAASQGQPGAAINLLAAMLSAALVLSPWACAAAIRIAHE